MEELTDWEPELVVDVRMVCHMVLYTRQQIHNLTKAGMFPRGFHFGPKRLVWPERDILDWMQQKVDARPRGIATVLRSGDRFIGKKELRRLVPYTPNYLILLERNGRFPQRVQLGPKRVAWIEREIIMWIVSKKRRVDIS